MLQGGVKITHNNSLNPLCTFATDTHMSIVGEAVSNEISGYPLPSNMFAGSLIYSTSAQVLFDFTAAGGDKNALTLKHLVISDNNPASTRGSLYATGWSGTISVLVESCIWSIGGSDNYVILTGEPNMRLSFRDSVLYSDVTQIQLATDGPHYVNLRGCSFKAKQAVNGRGWIETRQTSVGSWMTWGDCHFYAPYSGAKYYFWYESGGAPVTNNVDIIGACFGTHLGLSAAGAVGIPVNSTAGGGSILGPGQQIQDPGNWFI